MAGKVELEEYPRPPAGGMLATNHVPPLLLKDKQVRWALSHAVRSIDYREGLLGSCRVSPGRFWPAARPTTTTAPQPVRVSIWNKAEPNCSTKAHGLERHRRRRHPRQADRRQTGQGHGVRPDDPILRQHPQFISIAEIMADNCRQIGVNVQISPTKWALMLQKLREKGIRRHDPGLGDRVEDRPVPGLARQPGRHADSSNSIGYKNPAVNKLIDQLRVTLDSAEQAKLYHQIHRLIYEDQPYTFLFSEVVTAGRDARLNNLKFYNVRPASICTSDAQPAPLRRLSRSPPEGFTRAAGPASRRFFCKKAH